MPWCRNHCAAGYRLHDIYFSNLTVGKKTMTVGEEFTLEYSVIPEELQETAEIVWETSDKNVARVRKGKINLLRIIMND